MRARLIRPEFFSDEVMAALPVSARLTYIGLWQLADDSGYLEWHPREIGAALYGFESAGRRNRHIEGDLERLLGAGRVQLLECGVHALIPTLPDHRVKGGNLSFNVRTRHQNRCYVQVRTQSTDKYVSVSVSESESESVSVRRARARDEDASKRPTRRTNGPVPIAEVLAQVARGRGR